MKLKEKIITRISFLLHPSKRKLINISKKLNSMIGLEIGGPSSFFSIRSYLPIYLFAKRIDGLNFNNSTVWEGNIREGQNYSYYGNKKGYQFITEASDLNKIKTHTYDFVASCHCLEHVANPIKVLKEWNRVIKTRGYLILVLPDKNFTFDEARPFTTFEHLEKDFLQGIAENDTTHFNEVISLHNIKKDKGVQTYEQLVDRTINNLRNRCVHHHVFNFELITQMLAYSGFSIVFQQWVFPFHLVTIAEKI